MRRRPPWTSPSAQSEARDLDRTHDHIDLSAAARAHESYGDVRREVDLRAKLEAGAPAEAPAAAEAADTETQD